MRNTAIQKILDLRDYWRDVGQAAYAAGDRTRWREANDRLGELLLPFERLINKGQERITLWYWPNGFNRANPRSA